MNTTDTTAAPQRRTFTRELRVQLSEAEITARGRKLAARRADRAQLDEHRKAVAKGHGAEIARLDAELDGLQSAIQAGSELRPIQCYEEFRAGVVEIRRADTDEVIDTRIPTLSEQQTTLPGVDLGDDEPGEGSDEGAAADGEDAGDGGPAGDGDDDFGGAVARVKSATGAEVAHMPDDPEDGEAPDPGALGELAKPAKPAKPGKAKGRAPRKAK